MRARTNTTKEAKSRFTYAIYYREDGTTKTVRFPKAGNTAKKKPEVAAT